MGNGSHEESPATSSNRRTIVPVRHDGDGPAPASPADSEVERFLTDEAWCLQELSSGARVRIAKLGDTVTGLDSHGHRLPLPLALNIEMLGLAQDCVLDGMLTESTFRVCDLLEYDRHDCRGDPFGRRLALLVQLLGSPEASCLHLAPTAWGTEAKRRLWQELIRTEHRPVVFRRLDLP